MYSDITTPPRPLAHLSTPKSGGFYLLGVYSGRANPSARPYSKPALNENELIERYVERGLTITDWNRTAVRSTMSARGEGGAFWYQNRLFVFEGVVSHPKKQDRSPAHRTRRLRYQQAESLGKKESLPCPRLSSVDLVHHQPALNVGSETAQSFREVPAHPTECPGNESQLGLRRVLARSFRGRLVTWSTTFAHFARSVDHQSCSRSRRAAPLAWATSPRSF